MAHQASLDTPVATRNRVQAHAPGSRSLWSIAWWQLKRDKAALLGLTIVLLTLLLAVIGPYLAPYSVTEQNLALRRLPPSSDHLLGLDHFGRDILSRILVGTRLTLGISVLAVGIGVVLGVCQGVIAGFYRGWVDGLIMRLADTLLAFPYLLLS
jgi:peptide/nickel transport system permease protein